MNNRDRAKMKANTEKGIARTEPFDLVLKNAFCSESKKVVEAAKDICKLLLNNSMSYLEMNEALYLADKALQNKALTSR